MSSVFCLTLGHHGTVLSKYLLGKQNENYGLKKPREIMGSPRLALPNAHCSEKKMRLQPKLAQPTLNQRQHIGRQASLHG